MADNTHHDSTEHALVLSGGGARGAYQAGALRALYEICQAQKNFRIFRNLVGVSAGAINASYLAAHADDLDRATYEMCEMWKALSTKDVFKTDYVTVGRTALRFARGVTLGGFSDKLRPTKLGLLNVEPLKNLLAKQIDFTTIPAHIASGRLRSLCVSAVDYSTSIGVTFLWPHQKFKIGSE